MKENIFCNPRKSTSEKISKIYPIEEQTTENDPLNNPCSFLCPNSISTKEAKSLSVSISGKWKRVSLSLESSRADCMNSIPSYYILLAIHH